MISQPGMCVKWFKAVRSNTQWMIYRLQVYRFSTIWYLRWAEAGMIGLLRGYGIMAGYMSQGEIGSAKHKVLVPSPPYCRNGTYHANVAKRRRIL